MPLTKANNIVIDVDDVSTSLAQNTISNGIKDYIDDSLGSAVTTLTTSINNLTSSTSSSLSSKLTSTNNLSELTDIAVAKTNLGIGDPITGTAGLVRFASLIETNASSAVDAAVNVRNLQSGINSLVPVASTTVAGKVIIVSSGTSTSTTAAATPSFVNGAISEALTTNRPWAYARFNVVNGTIDAARSYNVSSITITDFLNVTTADYGTFSYAKSWRINFSSSVANTKHVIINGGFWDSQFFNWNGSYSHYLLNMSDPCVTAYANGYVDATYNGKSLILNGLPTFLGVPTYQTNNYITIAVFLGS